MSRTFNDETKQLGVVDLVVFFGTIGLAVAVGIYYAVVDRKKSVDNYYYGGRKMSPVPVGLSIAVTYISAITVVAFPAETYQYGTIMFWFSCIIIVPNIIACIYFIPMIHRLRLATINEYLEMRFQRYNRQLASAAFMIAWIFDMGVTIYVPSLALNAVTPLNLTATIIISSLACTIYTTLGGMKAVIWTDTIQTFAMAAGGLAAMIRALIRVGGLNVALSVADEGGRLNFWNFSIDPTLRYTVWTFVFGYALNACATTCVNQSIAQRYLSCQTVKKARIAALISVVPAFLLMGTAVGTGVAMYAYYEGCDPLASGKVEKPDQMMPYMVVDLFQDLQGIAGLFVAAAYSGTLSTVSSGLNSLAILLLHDFILMLKPNLPQRFRLTISKLLVFALGVITMCIALIISTLQATILRVVFSLTSILIGPLTGVFALGAFFPWASAKGALIGQICGTGFSMWISYGSLTLRDPSQGNLPLPLSTDKCPSLAANATFFTTSSHLSLTTLGTAPYDTSSNGGLATTLYAVSFLYYGTIAILVTVITGLLASFLTGANDSRKADPKLFIPFMDNTCFPESLRAFFRCGVPRLSEEYKRGSEKLDHSNFDEECRLDKDTSVKEKLTSSVNENVL